MTPLDPLELPLKPIIIPQSVSWWPLAPGWWVIMAAVMIGIMIGALYFYYKRKSRLRRLACKTFETHYAEYQVHQDKGRFVQALSYTLRQIATEIYPREVVSQQSISWLKTLDSRLKDDSFSQGVGKWLLNAPYLPPDQCQNMPVDALWTLCMRWAKTL